MRVFLCAYSLATGLSAPLVNKLKQPMCRLSGVYSLQWRLAISAPMGWRKADAFVALRVCAAIDSISVHVGLQIIYLRWLGELSMRALSLAEALKIIEATFAAAKAHNCHALAAIVLMPEGG